MLQANGMTQLMQKGDAMKTSPGNGMFGLTIRMDIHGPINGDQTLVRITTRGIGKTKTFLRISLIKHIKPDLNFIINVITPINKSKTRNTFNISHRIQDQLTLLLGPAQTPIATKLPSRQTFCIADEGVSNGRAICGRAPPEAIRQTINPNIS